MVSYKSGTNSQIWVKLDIIMKKIRSMFLMDIEKHISGGAKQGSKWAIWGIKGLSNYKNWRQSVMTMKQEISGVELYYSKTYSSFRWLSGDG